LGCIRVHDRLPLEAFCTLPKLRSLELAVNGIHSIALPPHALANLTELSLAHNSLQPEALVSLSRLPRLQRLDLSNNDLTAWPTRALFAALSAGEEPFPALRYLSLAHNRLQDPNLFLVVALFARLHTLMLNHNRLALIPKLPLPPGWNHPPIHFTSLRSVSLAHNAYVVARVFPFPVCLWFDCRDSGPPQPQPCLNARLFLV
jgi:Leucine-rich repeat (LRR) protein